MCLLKVNKLVICGGQKSKLKECLSMKFGNSDIFMDSFRLEKKLTMSNYTLLCFIVLRHKKKCPDIIVNFQSHYHTFHLYENLWVLLDITQ